MLRSKISMSVSAALLLGLVSITGCGNDTAGDNNMQAQNVRGGNDGRISVNSTRGNSGNHNIDKMEVSQELSDRISAMPEVSSAKVMLAGKNAYVAVTLNDASTGLNTKGTSSYRAQSSTIPHNYGPTGVMSGTGRVKIGRNGMNDTGAVANDTNRTSNGTVNTVPGTSSTGPAARDGIFGMDAGSNRTGTDTRGIGTRNDTNDNGPLLNRDGSKRDINMGIGNMGNDNTGTGMGIRSTTPDSFHMSNRNNTQNTNASDTVSKEIKHKIAAEIKKQNAKINAVYVTANPDFVQRVNYYADEARAGHPIKGFVDEFSTMVERIFPTRNY